MTVTLELSNRANQVEDSITMAISALAKQMKQEGKPVLSFSAGEPDFDTPENNKEAGIQSIKDGKTKYTAASGIPELKEAICAKFKADNNLDYTASNIVVSSGAKHSIYNTFLALINPGDEVIIPTPYWVSYPDQVKLCGGTPVFIETAEDTQFKITPEALEAVITPKTKLLILNSPSNPTGSLYSESDLRRIGEVVEKHSIYVLSDEIYEKLLYGTEQHISVASLSPALKELTVVINGVSKAYSMTGWRIGYLGAAEPIAKAVSRIQSHTTSNPAQASQWASLEALTGPQDKVETMRKAFDERRQYMVNKLNSIPGISCLEPTGAFYAFPNVSGCFGKRSQSGTLTDSMTFAEALLKEKMVATVPGAGFGANNNIRLSYATSMDDIKKGLDRLEEWVSTLS